MTPRHGPGYRVIDGPQYANWSRRIFEEMRRGGVSVVHATVGYHENFRDTVDLLMRWNERFRDCADLIGFAADTAGMDAVVATGRTAILLGLQNPSAIEADIGLVEVLHRLGIRFMQLSYNTQSLLCTGWTEAEDTGLTLMGREVIREMNRLGMVIDMSHSAERSTLEAIAASSRPIVVSHANPSAWKATARNKSDRVLRALAESGGMLGLSLYAAHLREGGATELADFVAMVRDLAERIGVRHIGLGSDLCQDQPASVVAWMRQGRWRHPRPEEADLVFPEQPAWFNSNLGFAGIREGLRQGGFSADEVEGIMWRNWYDFLAEALKPQA